MSGMDKAIKDLIQAFKDFNKSATSPYDTQAEVRRVEGDTVWVHIPGGIDETPVKMTINAKAGDVVQVRVSNGEAFLVGNGTAPPTDDVVANEAKSIANSAESKVEIVEAAIEIVEIIAETARQIAANTDQYFWHTTTGTDTGAHITEIPKEDFLEDPDNGGGNLLARSNGIAIRDGLKELATFGADEARIRAFLNTLWGVYETYLAINYHSIQMVDYAGLTYFHVSDLRDETGKAEITEHFSGNDTQTRYDLSLTASDTNYTVKVDDVEVTSGITKETYKFTFDSPVGYYNDITVIYHTYSNDAKAYTFGVRDRNEDIGPMSVAEGVKNAASGVYSHVGGTRAVVDGKCAFAHGDSIRVEGDSCAAFGRDVVVGSDCSFAAGLHNGADGITSFAFGEWASAFGHAAGALGYNLWAEYDYQFVTGKYNNNGANNAFEIGNGNSSVNSNALQVDWSGNTTIAGRLTQSSDRRLKNHQSYLSDDAVKFIQELKPAFYKKDGQNHVGFYAQDVEAADPWNCMVDEMNGFKTLGYTEIIAPLVKYCQSLEERIKELEDK